MDPKDLKRTAEWSFPDILFCVAASDDAQRVWFGSSDAKVYELDVSQEKPERVAFEDDGHTSYVTGITRSGDALLTCSYDKQLIWWDIESRRKIRSVHAHEKWIRDLIVTPDGRRAITVADDMRCRVWDFETGSQVADFSDHPLQTPHHYPSMLYAVAVSADGKRIATGDRVGHVAVWDADSFEKVGELETPVMYTWDPKQRRHSIGGIRSLAFSNDGRKLAVGGIGKIGNIDHLGGPARLEIFDLSSGDRLHEIEDDKKKGLIEQIVWGPDDKWIMTTGGDHNGFLTTYDSDSGEQLHQADQSGHVHAICWDESFENIFIAGHQKVSRWTMGE